MQPMAAGRSHIVHAHRSHGFQPRVDLRCADGEAAAAADADDPDALTIDEIARTEKIRRRAERFRIQIGRYGVARLTLACAPEGEVDGERDESPLGHLRCIKHGALLLDRPHRVTDDHRRTALFRCHPVGPKKHRADPHPIEVGERDLFRLHPLAPVKILRVRLRRSLAGGRHQKSGHHNNSFHTFCFMFVSKSKITSVFRA